MARIISFGDSWTIGDELLNPEIENYTHLLSNRCNVPYINYGQNGGSFKLISSYIFRNYSPQKGDFALVCIPPDIRDMGEDEEGNFISLYTLYNPKEDLLKYSDLLKKQYLYFMEVITNFKNWSPYHQLLNLFALQQFFLSHQTPILFFNNYGYINYNFGFNGKIDKSLFLSNSSLTTLLGGKDLSQYPAFLNKDGLNDKIFTGKYFEGNNTHPNPEGHKVIADTIYNHKMFQQWLMSTTNTES